MKKLTILCVAFIFVALSAVSISAQAEKKDEPKKDEPKKEEKSALVDNWEVTISAPGQELPGTLKIEKDGDNFKGAVVTALGEAPLKNIKIKDDSFTADMTANVQGQVYEGTMTGKLTDGKLAGEINLSGLGAIPYSGKKPEKK
jgi:hypothetical protein